MASFTQLTASLAIIAALSDLPNQTDGLTAAQLKAKYDEAAGLIKTYLNSTLIGELEASGASAKLGALVGGVASNIQAFITLVEAAGVGTLPPADSVTNAMLAVANKTGLLANLTTTEKATLVGAINELVTVIAALSLPDEILTTEGDLMYRNATVATRLAKGTAYKALLMNSGATAPQWLESVYSLLTARGDFITSSAANTPSKLALGSTGKVITSNGTDPVYDYVYPSQYVASNDILLSLNTERIGGIGVWETVKTFKLGATGIYRFTCELGCSTDVGCDLYAQILDTRGRNVADRLNLGLSNQSTYPLGTLTFDTFEYYTEPNTLLTVQIKCVSGSGASCKIKNFKVKGAVSAGTVGVFTRANYSVVD